MNQDRHGKSSFEGSHMDANLVLLKRDGTLKAFPLPSSVTVLGRRHDCDLRIPLASVSRRHCEFSVEADGFKVRDLGSRGGTFLNGRRLDGETGIGAGDQVRVGPLLFVMQIDGQPEKIAPPKPAGPKAAKPAELKQASSSAETVEDDFIDLDIDDSFVGLDDSSLGDLKDL